MEEYNWYKLPKAFLDFLFNCFLTELKFKLYTWTNTQELSKELLFEVKHSAP